MPVHRISSRRSTVCRALQIPSAPRRVAAINVRTKSCCGWGHSTRASWPRGRPTKVTPARHVVGTMRRYGAPSRGAPPNVSMTNANFPSAVRAAGTWNTARDGVSGARITTAITRAARAGGASSCAASTRAGTAYVRVPIRKELQHGRLGRQPALDGTRYAALNALGPLASPPRAHSPKAPHWPERYRHAFSVTMAASSKLRQALPKTPSRQSLRSPYCGTLDS